jgi:hypothetical protein
MKPFPHTSGLVIDQSNPVRAGWMNVDLGSVHPELLVVIAASNLDSAIAGAVFGALELQLQMEISIYLVGHKPDVVVLLLVDGVGNDAAILDSKEALLCVLGFAFQGPTREVFPFKEGLPRPLGKSGIGCEGKGDAQRPKKPGKGSILKRA